MPARTVATVVMASNEPIALFHNAVVGELILGGFSLGKSDSVSIMGIKCDSAPLQMSMPTTPGWFFLMSNNDIDVSVYSP